VRVWNHVAGKLSERDMDMVRAIPPGGNWRDIPVSIPSRRLEQIREGASAGTGSRSTYYGRLRSDRPAYTISTYYNRPGNGCTIHPVADRVLTDREAARLQTFPDAFRFYGPARARQAQIGNAVPPLLAAQIFRPLEPTTIVDLFSGAGGLSCGAVEVGHEVVAAVDNDGHALKTLAEAHGDSDLCIAGDLRDPVQSRDTFSEILRRLQGRTLGVLAGGPPCQGFSTAGPCRPDDARNALVGSFLEAVEVLNPHHVVMENVLGLYHRGRQLLEHVLCHLRAAGYETSFQVLHAEAFGVPQRRRRLIVQASRNDETQWPDPWRRTEEPSFRRLQEQHTDEPAAFGVGDAISDLPLSPAASADDAVAVASTAPSRVASWMRGQLPIRELLDTAHSEAADHLVPA